MKNKLGKKKKCIHSLHGMFFPEIEYKMNDMGRDSKPIQETKYKCRLCHGYLS